MKQQVKIYQPAKTAMQSGTAGSHKWTIDFGVDASLRTDSIMGWTGSADTIKQVHLEFASKEDAIAYAEKNGFAYNVVEPHKRKFNVRSYADNFSFNRIKTK